MGSAMSLAFEPHRFRSTVPFYAAHRVPYPDGLISFVAERCSLPRASPVLDLGCGPGQLAIAFARLGCAVTAMGPEPDMLAAAAKTAAASGVPVMVEGSSHDLTARCGPFQLVATILLHFAFAHLTLHGMTQCRGSVHPMQRAPHDWPSLLHKLGREFAPTSMTRRSAKIVHAVSSAAR